MTSRWTFITSSYSTTCLRMSKLWPSTFVWALSSAFPPQPLRPHPRLEGHVFAHAQLGEPARQPLGREAAHEVVLEADVEAGAARGALKIGRASGRGRG